MSYGKFTFPLAAHTEPIFRFCILYLLLNRCKFSF